MGGYRVRVSDTSIDTRSLDHAFTLGATGGLLAKMNGTFNVGLQVRRAETGETFVNYTTSSSFTWNASRKFNMTAQLSRDFATTASASTVDSFSAVLRATYVLTRKFEVNSGAGYGSNHFLGKNAPHRADQFVTFDAGARYSLNEHFTVNGSYTFLHNWSNVQFSVFTRNGFSLSVSSRY
jgi:outer membrane receptor for Fe3+-dicitrate